MPDLTKRYSISFIDDFVDCSYRTFLTRFAGIYSDTGDIPRVYGSGCHRGLARINKAMHDKRIACKTCKFNCKMDTVAKVGAMKRTIEECRIKQILMEEFLAEFDEEFEELALRKYVGKKTKEEVQAELLGYKSTAYNSMCSALFEKQPVGDVLMTEQCITGKLGGFDILGILDLVLGIKARDESAKSLVLDYKTAASAPTSAFPLRQLAMYIHMLEGMSLPVNGVGALYLLKKDAPKKPRKGSKPFKQTELLFMNLDAENAAGRKVNRDKYNSTIKLIAEDIDMIHGNISNGCFIRNRRSMFCPCDAAEYCENPAKLDKYMSEKGPPKVKAEVE